MKMRNNIIVLMVVLITTPLLAQSNLLNAKKPNEIGKKTEIQKLIDNDKPLEYGYIDDRDILWQKTVWEYLDLNEKINLVYYYPTEKEGISKNRRSLFDTLLEGIKKGEITEIYDDSYFTHKLKPAEVMSKLQKVDTTDAGYEEMNAGSSDISQYVDKIKLSSADIEGYKIKGVWYFDKRQGELKYRILAIAPVAPDVQVMGNEELSYEEKLPLFWIWYSDARNTLFKMKVFNPKNAAHPISYDHLLNAKRYSSIIYKEENVYGDREVKDYIKGNSLFQVLESQKIKEKIRNKELNMWSY
ncbi:MAG: gliding motility protein GldN [Flavobacteriaceae bacterium]|nr:gliding motility protein GldN [Flavobacteriaceae bacterium]